MQICIVDYGVGNLRSVQKAFESVGHKALITDDRKDLESSDALVLPGVGAFGKAMENLRQTGVIETLKEAVEGGIPFLGICLGLQLLFDKSEETFKGQDHPAGLGFVSGSVRKFQGGLKVPQIGWNQLHIAHESPLFKGIDDGSFVYFVHSYYVDPDDEAVVSTWTDYGVNFASSITRDNLMAIQFHPEKSSKVGLEILRNFADYAANMTAQI